MRVIPIETLTDLQKKPSQIRNICILAHVDHGKTTLADSLVAANGIISGRMAGRLRYMDSRQDEQERGITMKSSAIALYYKCDDSQYLINLIDSPGHIDFCGEVSTATRLCDGGVIVVDVVEGVCPQTHAVLRQAWKEGLRPILLLNKIDRLIMELKMTPEEAYKQLQVVLEQVNAIAGELFMSRVLEQQETTSDNHVAMTESAMNELDIEEEKVYFAPESGNVAFGCALDSWGFQISDFARFWSKKTGVREDILNKSLWGNYYLDGKAKKIRYGAMNKGKKPLFVQLILDNIWAVYEAVLVKKDLERVSKIITSLDIKMSARDQRHQDPKIHLQAIFGQWLPLAAAVLNAVCRHLPSPCEMDGERIDKLIGTGDSRDSSVIKDSMKECSSGEEVPTVVFVSKMFAVERRFLPEFRHQPLTMEEIQRRRQEALDQQQKVRFNETAESPQTLTYAREEPLKRQVSEEDFVFLAFARIFSGRLSQGQKLFVLLPGGGCEEVETGAVYMLMGREVENVDHVPAGNIVGIAGLEDHILKSATLSSSRDCPPLAKLHFYAEPIVRVSIETEKPSQMPALVRGLKLLNQADPCVKTFLQDTGEHVLVASGEVHLERCISDLKERFSMQIEELIVSEPIIPFMETIVPRPKVDRRHEAIVQASAQASEVKDTVEVHTSNKLCSLRLRAVPLSVEIVDVLEKYDSLLLAIEQRPEKGAIGQKLESLGEETRIEFRKCRKELTAAFEQTWKANRGDTTSYWGSLNVGEALELVDQIWALGPRKARFNLLLNRIPSYSDRPCVWTYLCNELGTDSYQFRDFDQSVVSGFQLRCMAGPLGLAFVVDDWTVSESVSGGVREFSSALSGQIITTMKEGCKLAFQAQPQRLLAAMYSCVIQATTEVLGKVYVVLSKRRGRVLSDEMKEGTNLFQITATLPVVESFGFADEIRKRTSGLASPQLVFSHWEVVDIDPFWVPTTEEELLHYGDKADNENQARKYMNSVRKRKGLAVDEKIVEFAEKQRNLSKKK